MWTLASRLDRAWPWRLALALLAVLSPAAPVLAQDTHYWSIQYGPVGQLLGGQLIGGATDLSATFYNPGALSLRNESSYLLSTESFQWEVLGVQPAPERLVFDASSSRFGAAPSLLAGTLPRWFGQDTSLAWSFLTRQKLDVRLGQRLIDLLPSPAVHSAAEAYFDQDEVEMWGGLTASRALSDSLGLGLTLYGVYRSQRLRNELTLEGIANDDRSLTALGVIDFQYYHYRTLAKLGLAWQGSRWKAGLSVTTPSLDLFGSGKAAYTLSLTGVDSNRDGVADPPSLSAVTLEDLDSHYKSSWAVGAGASRTFGSATKVYASAEWYAPVSLFNVIDLPESASPPSVQRLSQELGSVFNVGVGFERALGGDVSVYGAFHTDFSASLAAGPRADPALSDWDIYHTSGGASFRIGDNSFTLGVSWATGGKQRALATTIPPETFPGSVLGSEVDINYSKLTFLLGFVFGR